MRTKGQVAYHRSRLDAELQPLALCATDDGSEPMPLIVELSPGSIADLNASVARCEQDAAWAADGGERCLVIKPGQRGPGSVGQGPAEVDVMEAIEWSCRHYPIDSDRISVTGASMGGAATWYLASHYPDVFAAAAPFMGYCDYALWDAPGGHINRTQEWEHASWRSRGAAYRVENLTNMALWITHGEWDAAIGGGVPALHSRRMSQRLNELGVAHTYTEVPECGHGCLTGETGPPAIQWLCRQRRRQLPAEVRLVMHTLRHNRSFWVRVDQLEQYGCAGRVAASFRGQRLTANTEGVLRIALGPVPSMMDGTVVLDGQELKSDLSSSPREFLKADGVWQPAGPLPVGQKRHGASGPFGDLFFEKQRLIYGTEGEPRECFQLRNLTGFVANHFRQTNGGVHRGGIQGTSWYNLPFVADSEASEEDITENHLVLYGSPEGNAVLRRYMEHLPLGISAEGLEVAGRTYDGADLGCAVVFPHPDNPERCLAVISGNSPEAIVGSAYLNLQLLPDCLVWRGSKVWWGFLDSEWRKP